MKNAKNKRLSRKAKAYICLGSVLFVLLCSFLYFQYVVSPLVVSVSYAQVDSIATTMVSDAIYDVLQEQDYEYYDFMEISKLDDGSISFISANTITLNNFARLLSTKAQIYLDRVGSYPVAIPLGSFTGVTALSGIGPKVNVSIVPVGSIITSFRSNFVDAGINQTIHSLYIDVNVTLSVILPLTTKNMAFVTQVLICEHFINGKVPEVYLNFGNSVFE